MKLRGQRIDLSFIEVTLRLCASVTAAAVKVWGDTLAAYIVWQGSGDGSPADCEASLRRECEERLPRYMLPSIFVGLAALPLSPNGKADYSRLPRPAVLNSLIPPVSTSVCIIGAGVAGVLAALECGRRGLECRIFEAGSSFGGVWTNGTARRTSTLQQPSEGYV